MNDIGTETNYGAIEIIDTQQEVYTDTSKAYERIKRVMDVVLSSIAIVLLSPLFLIVGMAIRLESKGNVIYSQKRTGKDGKEFNFYKFRSMIQNADAMWESLKEKHQNEENTSDVKRTGPAFKLENDPRITKMGKLIRKTCIDELPQLINILRGEMSIVGPRPPLPKEVEEYTEAQKVRLTVTPGLTCYWQVNKGSVHDFEEWVALDIKYIQERNLLLDIKLIYQTIFVVLQLRGDK